MEKDKTEHQEEVDKEVELNLDEKSSPVSNSGSEDNCSTPIYKKTQIKRERDQDSVQIVDLSKSPKKRKQAIGQTPYSRILINHHIYK